MNHKEKLIQIYKLSYSITDIKDISEDIKNKILIIAEYSSSQKGVYTVLVTLLTHKVIVPEQDVRKHQANMEGGFSGRSIDTKYITPTLKELGLPSMNESGWLTRSLEQPYPYTLDYNGKISNKQVKDAFLEILDFIEKFPKKTINVLRILLNESISIKEKSIVKIKKLTHPETLSIQKIINALSEHFSYKYKTHNGSKLPVLAFYAIYNCLLKELHRYIGMHLGELGSHTASDKRGYSSFS